MEFKCEMNGRPYVGLVVRECGTPFVHTMKAFPDSIEKITITMPGKWQGTPCYTIQAYSDRDNKTYWVCAKDKNFANTFTMCPENKRTVVDIETSNHTSTKGLHNFN